jgi:hypothetical protein
MKYNHIKSLRNAANLVRDNFPSLGSEIDRAVITNESIILPLSNMSLDGRELAELKEQLSEIGFAYSIHPGYRLDGPGVCLSIHCS